MHEETLEERSLTLEDLLLFRKFKDFFFLLCTNWFVEIELNRRELLCGFKFDLINLDKKTILNCIV